MRAKGKLPFLQFYTSDWRADPRLRMCGPAARGLWIEMICLMHEASPYGHLLVSGQRPTDAQLAALVAIPSDQIPDLIGELETAGVFSRTRAGVIYSRRMTRMAKKAAIAVKNGRKGGNPNLRKERGNSASDKQKDNQETNPYTPESRVQRVVVGLTPTTTLADAASIDALFDAVLEASGAASAPRLPPYWMPPVAPMIVARWRTDLGLSDDLILETVRACRKRHTEIPGGPKAFDRAMQQVAAEIVRDPLTPTPSTGGRNERASSADERLRGIVAAAAEGTSGFGFGKG